MITYINIPLIDITSYIYVFFCFVFLSSKEAVERKPTALISQTLPHS